MTKRKILASLLLLTMAVSVLAACDKNVSEKSKPKENVENKTKSVNNEEAVVEGMYLTYGEDEYIFADIEKRSLFYAEIPDGELYDENDKKIEQKDLHAGDIVKCYGQGIILEMYPPKYPGISKMLRVKKGTKKDAAQYQDLIDEIYQEPLPSERPYMDIENKGADAIITTAASEFGYQWSYKDKNGKMTTENADALTVLQAKELIDINCNSDNSDLTLRFSRKPENVKVRRWDYGAKPEEITKGEEIETQLDGKNAFIKNAKRASIYEVTAEWENGYVIYGFYIK